jgi:tetratricopeptide (TPR) repeat protein
VLNPKVAALMDRGVQLLQSAQYLEAARAFERAAQQSPTLAEAHAMRADALMRAGRLEPALAGVERAMRLRPDWVEVLVMRGNIEALLGRHQDAERSFRSAVAKGGEVPELRANLGHALRQQQRWAEALKEYEFALATRSQSAPLHLWKGEMLWALDRRAEAEQSFRHAIALDAGLVNAHRGLAVVLHQLGKHAEAEAVCRLLVDREPTSVEAIGHLADVLEAQGRHSEVETLIRERLNSAASAPALLIRLGAALWRSAQYDQAIDVYREAAALASSREDPRFIEAKVDEAVGLLALGRWAEGWSAYRWRYNRDALKSSYPQLVDEPRQIASASKTLRIRLRADQGIGDELFFLRFAPRLKELGHRLALLTGAKQRPLLSQLTDVIDVVEAVDSAAPAPCDAELLCSDLPLVTREVLPQSLRFRIDPARLDRALRQLQNFGPPPYLGVTWRAGPTLDEQLAGRLTWVYGKQVPIKELADVLRPLAASVVVLQRRASDDELARFGQALGREALDMSAVHDELEDALALLSVLDEYIGVSSTNMHLLAGIECKHVRVLVQNPAEWRWGLEGDSSPWFPGFRIYRQARDRSWVAALGQLAADLRPLRCAP